MRPKLQLSRRALGALSAVVLLCLSAAGCAPDKGREIAEFEMIDMSAPAMFRELARNLRRPFLLEMPLEPITGRYDLTMKASNQREVLEAICRTDSKFQFEMSEDALVLWPVGEDEAASPYSVRLDLFRAEGGAMAVLEQLVTVGIPAATTLSSSPQGQKRAVKIEARNATIRDIMLDVATQAHLELIIERGHIRMSAAPQS